MLVYSDYGAQVDTCRDDSRRLELQFRPSSAAQTDRSESGWPQAAIFCHAGPTVVVTRVESDGRDLLSHLHHEVNLRPALIRRMQLMQVRLEFGTWRLAIRLGRHGPFSIRTGRFAIPAPRRACNTSVVVRPPLPIIQ